MAGFPSTIPADQSFNLIDLERGNYRLNNDTSFGAMTTAACDFGYSSLTASGNTLVKTGPGELRAIVCGTATGNITIYDGTTSSGTLILAASALAVGVTIFEVSFNVGLFIVLSGAGVATATYR